MKHKLYIILALFAAEAAGVYRANARAKTIIADLSSLDETDALKIEAHELTFPHPARDRTPAEDERLVAILAYLKTEPV